MSFHLFILKYQANRQLKKERWKKACTTDNVIDFAIITTCLDVLSYYISV